MQRCRIILGGLFRYPAPAGFDHWITPHVPEKLCSFSAESSFLTAGSGLF
jgi:hypothetical protein